MKIVNVLAGLALVIWGQPLLVLFLIFPLIPVLVPLLLWVEYEKYCEREHQKMALAANVVDPGTYCDECFSKLAGNTAEHPHTYACSHSKQLFSPGKQSHL